MQKARIRTGWKKKGKSVSLSELANALSAICWRLSLNAAKNLHEQDFLYDNDHQRIDAIREYLFFLMHCADRLMYLQLAGEERQTFLTTLVQDCQRHYDENTRDILDQIPNTTPFVDRFNQTTTTMAGFRFTDDQPGYEIYRLLGARIRDIMGHSQMNKWVIDQVMDVDGPEIYDLFKKSFNKLKRASGY